MVLTSRSTYNLKSVPGAVVTFRRPTAASRAVFLQSQAATLAKIREIQRQRKPHDEEHQAFVKSTRAEMLARVDAMIETEKITRQEAERRIEPDLMLAYMRYRAEHPEWADSMDLQGRVEHDGVGWARLRQMVAAVENLSDEDGAITTADEIINRCPPEITDELIAEAERIAGLSATERGESPSLGTSQQAEDGANQSTTAMPAESAPAAA
jgi:hypothetical protein